jgi:hypothetical protein
MQHYGISTRLLDWTESHLTALYFAVLNYKQKSNAAVWVLDGWSLNENSLGIQSIPTSDSPRLIPYCIQNDNEFNRNVEGDSPVAVRPSRSTPRIIAQKGTFTIHGKNIKSLDDIAGELNKQSVYGRDLPFQIKVGLDKIVIRANYKKRILQNLMQAGISHSVLFPELEGLAKEINFRYSNEYMRANGHHHNGF